MKIVRPLSEQPMPKSAKRVFKGVVFDVYQWQQQMFDGTYETFEKIKRVDTVIVLPVTKEGKIILTKQQQPNGKLFTGVAGGRVDEGEGVLAAAKRELLEETGYEAVKFELLDAIQPVGKIDWALYTFIAKGCKKVAEIKPDAGEKIELMPVSFEEFLEISVGENFRDPEIPEKLLRDGYAKIVWNKSRLSRLKKMFS
jgi:8-oxo-dGTP pyrophosphatase MutT (NUDIX family)